MIKDNIIALIYHTLLIIISTIYLILIVVLSPYIGEIIIKPGIRMVLAIIWVASYIVIGTKLDIKHMNKYDFNKGLLIALFGIILWAYSLIQTGFTIEVTDEGLFRHLIPLNIYLNPIYQICFLLNIKFNQIIRFIACFIPTLLIGMGITIKRVRYHGRRQKSI